MTDRAIYRRGGKGLPSLEEQDAELRKAGVEADGGRIYTDEAPRKRRGPDDTPLPELEYALMSRRVPGDELELWVSHPCVFATSEADAKLRMARLTEQGATLCIASTGGRYRWHPDAAPALRLCGQIADDLVNWRTKPGREGAARKAARTKEQQAQAWKRLREMWPASAGFTLAQIKAETGISPRTAYNAVDRGELPPRDAQPFTGGPKMKAKHRRKGT